MDVSIYPDNHCDDSPSKAHHFIYLEGSIWRCKYCWKPKWMPADWYEATDYSVRIKKVGVKRAYKYFVSNSIKIQRLLQQFEEIRLLRKTLPDKEFEVAVIALLAGTSHSLTTVKKIMDKEQVLREEGAAKAQAKIQLLMSKSKITRMENSCERDR